VPRAQGNPIRIVKRVLLWQAIRVSMRFGLILRDFILSNAGAKASLLAVTLVFAAVHIGCKKSSEPDKAAEKTEPPKPAFVPPPVIARFHFRGLEALLSDTNLTALQSAARLPETAALKRFVLQKLALSLSSTETNAFTNQAATLAAVLDGALQTDSYLEARAASGQQYDWSWAILLAGEKAQPLRSNLVALGWTSDNSSNKAAALPLGGTAVRNHQFGEWTLLTWGSSQTATNYGLYSELARNGRPAAKTDTNVWLTAEFEPSRFPLLQDLAGVFNAGKTELQVKSRKDSLRTEAKIALSKPLPPLKAWNIPTNTLRESPRDTIVSFSAIQGLRPWLATQTWIKDLQLAEIPDQAFLWTKSAVAFQVSLAADVGDSTNAVQKIGNKLITALTNQLAEHFFGRFQWPTNGPGVFWRDLPVAIPFVRPAEDPGFIEIGLFPLLPDGQPAPAELMAQVTSRTNLVYYDWEVTSARTAPTVGLNQFISLATDQFLNRTPMEDWMNAIAPLLGNTVTEITASGPAELSLARRSDIGFNSFELGFFLRWLDSPNFPRFGREFWLGSPTQTFRNAARPPGAGAGPALTNAPPAVAPAR
jgi:hypothetical protein